MNLNRTSHILTTLLYSLDKKLEMLTKDVGGIAGSLAGQES